MSDILKELEQLKLDIKEYLQLKEIDFNTIKSELVDVARFSEINDYSKMIVIFKELEQCSFMYRNVENFLKRLSLITEGVTIGEDESIDAKCAFAYVALRNTDEYKIVKKEIEKRLSEQKSKGL